jgi:SAM-dependent methyltransferase
MKLQKQVDRSHYNFSSYMKVPRWNSLWYQLNVVSSLEPKTVLEIGPGAGMFTALMDRLGTHIETVDIDPELEPDHVASASELPLGDDSFDAVCAFQVLEHMPFDIAISALDELARVARRNVVVSLPDSRRSWRYLAHFPRLGERQLLVPRPQFSAPAHHFDGEHYWEINKKGYELAVVKKAFLTSGKVSLLRTFRPFENPYHRFFVFAVNK